MGVVTGARNLSLSPGTFFATLHGERDRYMITLTIDGLTMEVERGVYIYFGTPDGRVDFYMKWDELESQELKDQLCMFERRAENVLEKLAQVVAILNKEMIPEAAIN